MARRILNRKDLRADYDAAERRKGEPGEAEETEEVDDEEEAAAEGGEGDEEAAPKKKKAKAPAKAKTTKPRTRTPKVVRKRVVWIVHNNSNHPVATFDYPKRKDADELAARLTVEKKQTHFVQPAKQDIIEEKA
jgi:hypothetical protein